MAGKPRVYDEIGRRCTKCKLFRARAAFRTNGVRVDGSIRLRSVCIPCGSMYALEHTAPKICRDCGKRKPASEFSENGRHPYCRSCANERTYAYRRGAGRAAHNARMGLYQKEKYDTDPLFRQKTAARKAVQQALLTGHLKRPKRCPECGRRVRLHAHHHKGYDKANQLAIRWLCPICHYKEDRLHD